MKEVRAVERESSANQRRQEKFPEVSLSSLVHFSLLFLLLHLTSLLPFIHFHLPFFLRFTSFDFYFHFPLVFF